MAAAARTGDPVLTSASLDLAAAAAREAGRSRQGYQLARERLPLLTAMDRVSPYPAPEIHDTMHSVANRAAFIDARVAIHTRNTSEAVALRHVPPGNQVGDGPDPADPIEVAAQFGPADPATELVGSDAQR